MTFWEKHRSALLTGLLGLFLLAVSWLGYLRPSSARAADLREEIDSQYKDLAPYHLELDRDGFKFPRMDDVRAACDRRRQEYEKQLKDLKARVRFPFKEDFPWTEVTTNPALLAGMRPGVYVNQQYPVREESVRNHGIGKNRVTAQARGWLGFVPSRAPESVTLARAEEDLRRLALAEKITKLAIDSRVRWVQLVTPQDVAREAAYGLQRNPRPRRGEPQMIKAPYDNKFIKNYPVGIRVIGPIDSIMTFFHSMRGERHFLVIRNFNIASVRYARISEELRADVPADDLVVEISAACMDFVEPKPGSGQTDIQPLRPDYVPPRLPMGH